MANPEHVERLVNSTAEQWNKWRAETMPRQLDVSGSPVAGLRKIRGFTTDGRADFRDFHLQNTNLTGTIFDFSDISRANMSYTSYRRVLLMGAKMHGTKLIETKMQDCVLALADMTGAKLTNTQFRECYFDDAYLSEIDMRNVEFTDCDLTGAAFPQSDLSTVRFVQSNLTCSSLQYAGTIFRTFLEDRAQIMIDNGRAKSVHEVISRTESAREKIISGSELNESESDLVKYIFDINSPGNRRLSSVESVQDLFCTIGDKIRFYVERYSSRRFRVYYRGHACGRWAMESSLDHDGLRGSEHELLSELAMIQPDEFRDAGSTVDQLVLARHHSLPARMLDVTRSPLVALYFACLERASCKGQKGHETCPGDGMIHMLVTPSEMVMPYDADAVNVVAAMSRLRPVEQNVILTKCPLRGRGVDLKQELPHTEHMRPWYEDVMRRLVHFVARDKPYFRNAIDPRDFFRVFVVEPKRAFTRVRAQSGAFLLSGFHKEFEADKIAAKGPKIPIYDHYTIDVPRDAKPGIMKQLGYAQITDETMLPGLEPVATYIAERYGTRKED